MTWIETRLQLLADNRFFDNLPGSGQPIADIDVEYSPTWWAEHWVRRDSALRTARELRIRLVSDVEAALAMPNVQARQRLERIARRVGELNVHLDTAHRLPAIDVDTVLIRRGWIV